MQDDWVYWLILVKFTYNNRVHASIRVTLFYAEKGFLPSIEATLQAIPADGSILDVLDAKAQADS